MVATDDIVAVSCIIKQGGSLSLLRLVVDLVLYLQSKDMVFWASVSSAEPQALMMGAQLQPLQG